MTVEGFVAHDIADVRFHETNIGESSFGNTGSGLRQRAYVALDTHDLSCGIDHFRRQHGDVADA
jgi:hypothetical protein